MTLTEGQQRCIDLLVNAYGAANLEVITRRNYNSVTIGFRCYKRGGDTYTMNAAFRVDPKITRKTLDKLVAEIESYLDGTLVMRV